MARRGSVKVGAVALAAVFGVFTPGIGPLNSATAQDATKDEERPVWAPTGTPGPPPEDPGKPDKTYVQEIDCITSGTEGRDAVAANAMKDAPPAQRLLRLNEVHNYVRQHSPAGKVGANKNTGAPLKVAVIDTGVTPHRFFQNRVKPGGDYVMNTDGREDCDGHGTQVAGIIGANPQAVDESIAFTGVAPDVQIISIRQSSQNFRPQTEEEKEQIEEERKREQEAAKAAREAEKRQNEIEQKQRELDQKADELEKKQNEDDDTDSAAAQPGGGGQDPRAQGSGAGNQGTLAKAIVNAVDKNVDVINMSVDACRPNTGNYTPDPGDESDLRGAIRYAVEKNVVVVAAAGNVGGACVQNDVPEPAAQSGQAGAQGPGKMPDPNHPPTIVTPPWFSEDLLAVAAVDGSGGVADFSMRGPWVSVAAPGTDITSLDPAPGSELLVNATFDGDKPQRLQGTSFAAPYVAGLAVLVRQMYPDLNAREVMDRIKRTAQHPGARDGHDQFVGYGLIDPMAALTVTFPEELGVAPAKDREIGSDMPPLVVEDQTPVIVALAGAAGGLGALGVTLFVVRTVRRRKGEPEAAAT